MAPSLRDLVDEYDRLGDVDFSSPHNFARRQRHLSAWAERARNAIAELVRRESPFGADPQPAITGAPTALDQVER